jgi:hypothetical protein
MQKNDEIVKKYIFFCVISVALWNILSVFNSHENTSFRSDIYSVITLIINGSISVLTFISTFLKDKQPPTNYIDYIYSAIITIISGGISILALLSAFLKEKKSASLLKIYLFIIQDFLIIN